MRCVKTVAEAEIEKKKPKNKTELMRVVDDFCVELNQTPEKIQKIVKNIRKRAHYCVLQNGDLFEHLLSKEKRISRI